MGEEKRSWVCTEGGLSNEEYPLLTEGLGLIPAHMSGGSQLSVTPVSADPSGLYRLLHAQGVHDSCRLT